MGRTYRERARRKLNQEIHLNQDIKVISLMRWLKQNNWKPDVNMKVCAFSESGRGLKCMKNIAANSVIISIPEKLLITRYKVISSMSSNYIQLKSLATQTLLALFLMCEKSKGKNSFWYPYLDFLPESYSVPYFSYKKEIQNYPEYVLLLIKATQIKIMEEYKKLNSIIDVNQFGTFEKFLWAWFTVNTRAVYFADSLSNSDNCLALAPYLDLFNHSFDTSVKVGMNLVRNSSSNVYQIITETGFPKFSQVFINYGPHNNLKLLVEYGFIYPNNPHDSVPLCLDDLLLNKRLDSIQQKIIDILKESNLLKNLCIYDGGVSWNTLACLRILRLNKLEIEHWKTIYSEDLETLYQSNEFIQLLANKRSQLCQSIDQFKLNFTTLSLNTQIALEMFKTHLNMISSCQKLISYN